MSTTQPHSPDTDTNTSVEPVPKTSLRDEFVAHLNQIIAIRGENTRIDDKSIWTGPEELLLSMVGEPIEVATLTLPPEVEAGETRACYRNAFNISVSHPTLVYTEGLAYAGFFPMWHAFLTDTETGAIVDPTWVNLDYEGPFFYMGLKFSRQFMARLIAMDQDPSVFEADWRRKRKTTRCGLILDKDGLVTDWGDPPPF